MLRKRILLLSICFLVASINAAFAKDATVEFEGRYWITDLDAEAKVVESGLGSKFDFKADLGVGDEDFPEGRLTWHTGKNSKIRLAYTQVDYSGAKDITKTVEFSGKSYTAGTRVNSGFDITYLRLGWIWQFINLGEKVKLGPIIEGKGIMADISLEAPDLSPAISESKELIGGLPTAGLALNISPIDKLDIFAEISGLPAGSYGYFFDAEAGIKFSPLDNLDILGGFRVIDIKVEYSDDLAKAQISGPFVGATLKF